MKKILLASLVVLSLSAFAARAAMVPAAANIHNLSQALTETKAKIHYTKSFSDQAHAADKIVAFPSHIPKPETPLFASLVSQHDANSDYTIFVGSSADCNGTKTCNVGMLQLQHEVNPVIVYDRNNQQQTFAVKLNHDIQGFYTHGYAMADYFPASIAWRDGDVLYTLQWQTKNERNKLIEMANSVISQLHAH